MLNKKRLIIDSRKIKGNFKLFDLTKMDFFTCDLIDVMENLKDPFYFVFYAANDGDMIGRLTLHDDRIEFIRPLEVFEGKKNETFIANFEDMMEEAEIVKIAKPKGKGKNKSYATCLYIRFGVYRVRDRLV